MKKSLAILTVLLMAVVCSAVAKTEAIQRISYPGGKCFFYRLYLRDKKGCPYSLNQADSFLSRRALERRQRQHIAVDSTDLPVSPLYMRIVKAKGLEIIGKSKWNNTLLIRISSEKQLKSLDGLDFITKRMKVFTAPDSINHRTRTVARKEFSSWNRSETEEYGTTALQTRQLNGMPLHAANYRGKGKLIAVFDGGFMNVDRIPAFHNVRFAAPPRDFVVPRAKNIYQEMDHGTMVLSTLAADEPHYFIGTAPDAEYVLVRCEDEYTESRAEEDYWAEAAEYADSLGVDVINSSLGYHDFDDKSSNYPYSAQDGMTALISRTASMIAHKGMILVNSAGNDGMGSWKRINFPADARDILTVGAVDEDGVNAPFSSVGPTADGRIKPDCMALGSSTSVISGRGSIINDMGTSFSAPLVAGLVACLWQALPDKNALQIMDLVRRSSSQFNTPDNVYGYGIPDFWKALKVGR